MAIYNMQNTEGTGKGFFYETEVKEEMEKKFIYFIILFYYITIVLLLLSIFYVF